MLCTTDIIWKFGSLSDYESFQLAWTRECARLNPTEKNKQRLVESEKRAELLGVEA